MQEIVRESGRLTLRPRFARIAGRAYASGALAVVPPFAALYWLTAGTDRFGLVIVFNVVVAVVIFSGITMTRGTSVVFTEAGIRERGYFGQVTETPHEELESILVVQVNDGRSLKSQTNVFFLDHAGRTRLRLRGEFWSDESVEQALEEYELPTERLTEAIARSELRHRYRANLYLHERYPVLTYSGFAILLLAIGIPVVNLLTMATS